MEWLEYLRHGIDAPWNSLNFGRKFSKAAKVGVTLAGLVSAGFLLGVNWERDYSPNPGFKSFVVPTPYSGRNIPQSSPIPYFGEGVEESPRRNLKIVPYNGSLENVFDNYDFKPEISDRDMSKAVSL